MIYTMKRNNDFLNSKNKKQKNQKIIIIKIRKVVVRLITRDDAITRHYTNVQCRSHQTCRTTCTIIIYYIIIRRITRPL